MIEPDHETAPPDDGGEAHRLPTPVFHCPESMRRLRRRSQGPAQRSLRRCGWVLAGAGAVVLLVGSLIFARLAMGPLGLSAFNPYIRRALEQRLGSAYVVTLGGSSVEFGDRGPALSVAGLSLASASGRSILQAPRAEVSLDPLDLLVGKLRPTSLEVYGVELHLMRLTNGAAAISVAGARPVVLSGLLIKGSVSPASKQTAPPGPLAWIGAALTGALDSAAAPDSPLAALQSVGVARGRLVFEDQVSNQTVVFDGLELSFDKTAQGAQLSLSAEGPNGRWTLAGVEHGAPGRARAIDLSARGFSIDEIALAAGKRDLGFDLDSPIAAEAHIGLAANGGLLQASGAAEVGEGFFHLDDPDHEPIELRRLVAQFQWNRAKQRVDVDRLTLDEGDGSHFEMAGSVTAPKAAGDRWFASFSNQGPAWIGAYRPGEKRIEIDRLDVALGYVDSPRRLSVDSLIMTGPRLDFRMSAGLEGPPEAPQLVFTGAVKNTALRTVIRAWPTFIAAPARAWLIDHVQGGLIQTGSLAMRLSADDLAALRQHHAPADDHSHMTFSIAGAAVSFFPGVPALSDIDGSGVITGHSVSITARSGVFKASGDRTVTLLNGAFTVANTDPKPTPATITAHLNGTLDAVADVIGRPALKPFGGGVPIDTSLLSGQVDAQLTIDTKLGKYVKPSDTKVQASASVDDFMIQKIIGKQRIDQADLAVAVDAGGLHATGEGRLLGAPATIDLERAAAADSVTRAVVTTTLDDAARAKLGFGAPGLKGPVGAIFRSRLGQGDAPTAQVDLDLTQAAIQDLVPGYSKAAGQSAKASFVIAAAPEGADITDFVYDAGSSSARGDFQLDASGALRSVHLTEARLSPGDDMRVDAEQGRDGMKVVLVGAVLDARPFLHSLSTGSDSTRGGKDFDLLLKCGLVTGANEEAISNLTLHVAERHGALRQFELSGRFGRHSVVGQMLRNVPGDPQVTISSADAGRLLAFADLYKRVQGGALSVTMAVGQKSVAGRLMIRNFVIKDEPGLRRMLAAGAVQQPAPSQQLNPNVPHFTKLQVDFTRSAGEIVLRDGSMFGPMIGTTVEGWIDFARNKVDLSGTFVPIYGVNNLFAQIPLVGPILGGGAHEGLIGLNYRITGPASAPVLAINPLSIAPGFLRKVFGAFDSASAPPPQ